MILHQKKKRIRKKKKKGKNDNIPSSVPMQRETSDKSKSRNSKKKLSDDWSSIIGSQNGPNFDEIENENTSSGIKEKEKKATTALTKSVSQETASTSNPKNNPPLPKSVSQDVSSTNTKSSKKPTEKPQKKDDEDDWNAILGSAASGPTFSSDDEDEENEK